MKLGQKQGGSFKAVFYQPFVARGRKKGVFRLVNTYYPENGHFGPYYRQVTKATFH